MKRERSINETRLIGETAETTMVNATNTTETKDFTDTGAFEIGIIVFSTTIVLICCYLYVFAVHPANTPNEEQEETERKPRRLGKRKAFVRKHLTVREWVIDEATANESTHSTTGSLPLASPDDALPCPPKEPPSSSLSVSFSEDNGCAICYSNFQEHDLVCESNNTECHHIFHKECMSMWLSKHLDCPICREVYILESV